MFSMSDTAALIASWARSAVAPLGGAFHTLTAHDIAAPVLLALLQRAGLSPDNVDAVVLGNALGAGGNPARMVALAAGLPDRCAAFSIDTQCCSGLDAVAMAVGLLTSGQAEVVVAGGAEAWSRSPIRQHRPLHADAAAVPFDRPAFAPDPARDPDLIQAAADYAAAQGLSRQQQDLYACESHARAVQHRDLLTAEIVPVRGLAHDAYPRHLRPTSVARMPVQAQAATERGDTCAVSTLAVSARADGAALVLLMTPQASLRLGITARAQWLASASVGGDPAMPLLAAEAATRTLLCRAGVAQVSQLHSIELHDAFAVQGLAYCQALGLETTQINRFGGGVARGHPIGASGAIALVRVLADLQRQASAGALGLASVAGAGGIGAAALVRWC